jgi:flagellar biosynthesis anti-sigma factor FlgM
MTSPISSYSQSSGLPDPIGSAAGAPAASPPGASSSRAGAPAPSGEAVTLTPDAQTSTDLLEAARSAPGVDYQAVQSLKAEIASGTYQVPSENLAASIVAAFAETRS